MAYRRAYYAKNKTLAEDAVHEHLSLFNKMDQLKYRQDSSMDDDYC